MELFALVLLLVGSFAGLSIWDRRRPPLPTDPTAARAFYRRGRISLALVFMMTGLSHFVVPQPMAEMLPPWVPARVPIIYFTGLLEWAGAVGLLLPKWSRLAGCCLCLFLILIFPSNVYSALQRVPLGGHGAGPIYLLARTPVQILLIWWAYWFAARRAAHS